MSATDGPLPAEVKAILDDEPRTTEMPDEFALSSSADILALESELGLSLPDDLRWILEHAPRIRLRERRLDHHDVGRRVLLDRASFMGVPQIRYFHPELTRQLTGDRTEEPSITGWASRLVPIAGVEGGQQQLCLDFRFDADAPPVVLVFAGTLGAPSTDLTYVARSVAALIELPVIDENDARALAGTPEANPDAETWMAWREQQLKPA